MGVEKQLHLYVPAPNKKKQAKKIKKNKKVDHRPLNNVMHNRKQCFHIPNWTSSERVENMEGRPKFICEDSSVG